MASAKSDAFDAVAWLNRFAAIGGGYALTSGRKLHFLVEACEADDLSHSMAELVGDAERQEAVKRTIELRGLGQIARSDSHGDRPVIAHTSAQRGQRETETIRTLVDQRSRPAQVR